MQVEGTIFQIIADREAVCTTKHIEMLEGPNKASNVLLVLRHRHAQVAYEKSLGSIIISRKRIDTEHFTMCSRQEKLHRLKNTIALS